VTDGRAASAPSGLKLRPGNQMVVESALRAGCRFFIGYPITPASEIYREMTLRLQARAGRCGHPRGVGRGRVR